MCTDDYIGETDGADGTNDDEVNSYQERINKVIDILKYGPNTVTGICFFAALLITTLEALESIHDAIIFYIVNSIFI